ncbi:MAG: sulfite exporter TauE/SafE family protein [Pyrinomonadaceae bacterium]
MFFLGLVLSAAIGLSLGLIGGGGSILTVPILVYFLGVGPHSAVAMSLAVVGATSLFGTYLHWRVGNVDLSGGSLFGITGVAGALVGSPLTRLVSPEVLLLIFGVLMLVVASVMLLGRRRQVEDVPREAHPVKAAAAGAGVGVLTGFLGVGGGFLIVPALVLFGGMTMKKAIGTSLLVIFLNCVAGLVGHVSQGVLDWRLMSAVLALSVGGAAAGTLLSHRLEAHRLQRLFAILVLTVAVFLIAKNYTAAA